jgi:nicotinate-nucleotide--dimethylbenzimidazole phosphoribosyltransferase
MAARSLVSPTSHAVLERALVDKLQRRKAESGGVGELEPLAVRLGLVQRTLKPRFVSPQLLVFAADHGIALDGLNEPDGRGTHEMVQQLLRGQLPMSVFARQQGLELNVVDCGMAQNLPASERLLARKIAHGTRHARISAAMTVDQAHAAMRAGMEIGDQLKGNAVALAGMGVGANESAAMVLARLSGTPVRDLLVPGPRVDLARVQKMLDIAKATHQRHPAVTDAVEVLAAFGGFEVAVMVGVMLMAASKRHLLVVDGLPACAALMIATRIAEPVTDYAVFTRSHGHRGLDKAMGLFQASALMELGLEGIDGTGAALAWPLLAASAALLSEVVDGEDPGPSWPGELAEDEADSLRRLFPGEALY